MDNNPTHRFSKAGLPTMEGTLIEDPWDGTMFMPHPRYHAALEARGFDLTGGLFVGGEEGGEVTPL